MKEEVVIMEKKGRMIMLAIGSLVFVGLGFLILAAEFEEPFWPTIAAIISIVFFGLCFLYYVKTIIGGKPALIISNEGILDRSSYVAGGFIRWDEMESMGFVQFSGQTFLGIFTIDPDLVINRSSGMKKKLMQANKKLVQSQVNIPVKNLAISPEELINTINERWETATAYASDNG